MDSLTYGGPFGAVTTAYGSFEAGVAVPVSKLAEGAAEALGELEHFTLTAGETKPPVNTTKKPATAGNKKG